MYSLIYYVPESHHQQLKQALFSCGAGKVDHYEHCCWEVKGRGQFRAMPGSQPHTGRLNQLEQLSEYKVEMICLDENIKDVVKTLVKEHPYEQPAYFFYPVLTLNDL